MSLSPDEAEDLEHWLRLALTPGVGPVGARALLEQFGLQVRVLEASDRIGGRLLTLDDVPGRPEAGGSQIGAAYARVVDTARIARTSCMAYSPSSFNTSGSLLNGGMQHMRTNCLPRWSFRIDAPANRPTSSSEPGAQLARACDAVQYHRSNAGSANP